MKTPYTKRKTMLIRKMADYSHLPAYLRLPLKAYKLTLSPAIQLTGIQCRHMPTCSEYMAEAMQAHGFWNGGWVGVNRLCRCHPWGTKGYDPIPETLPKVCALTPWRLGGLNTVENSTPPDIENL